MRLDKLIEKELQTSRKELKRLFLMGKVRIDGEIERSMQKNVDSRLHTITVSSQQLETKEVYYLMNKPSGVVTANKDARHPTVMDLLTKEAFSEDLYSVGRLDRDTQGLVLLTNNGQLGYDLLHPVKKVVKIYEAVVNEPVTAEDVEAFAKGITFIGGVVCQPAKLTVLATANGCSTVRLAISEGKFHQVKKMFLARGKKVTFLKRIALGPLSLPEDLPLGSFRELTLSELKALKPYFR